MTPIKNYEKLYSFPEVWKAIFQLIYNGSGWGSPTKGIGDPYVKELQDIERGIQERQFYPKSFSKVWRALRFINEKYNLDDNPDDSSDDSSDSGTGGGNEQLKKVSNPTKETKIQEEP